MKSADDNLTRVIADAVRGAAHSVRQPARPALETFLDRLAESNPKEALRCADQAAGILHQLAPAQQHIFLERALSLVDVPEAAGEFFRHCDGLAREFDEESIRLWVEEGSRAARENPRAGVAFFRMESHASNSLLQRLRRLVRLRDVNRLLQLYCIGVSGKSVGVKATTEAPPFLARGGHHLPLTDGATIYLPEQLGRHASHKENFSEYKVVAAHQAGYIEFGTFGLDIDDLLDHSTFAPFRPLKSGGETSPIVSHYDLFFGIFADRTLARDIFFAVEDGRIDFRLRRTYQGLTVDLEKTARASLAERPAVSSLPLREALVEALIRLSISGQIEESLPPHVLPAYRHICEAFSRVLHRRATVEDSCLATARIYLLLASLPNVPMDAPLCKAAIGETMEMMAGILHEGPRSATAATGEAGADYRPAEPVPYRGQTRPELVQMEIALDLATELGQASGEEGIPLTPEFLEELLRRGAKIKITEMTAKELAESSSLFITDLGGMPQQKVKKLTPEERRKLAGLLKKAAVVRSEAAGPEPVFFYDEWDYLIGDYRTAWCRLREIPVKSGSSQVIHRIRKEQSALISAVIRHFQRIRPEMLRRVKRLRSGEEIELDATIEAVVDRRAGLTPSERIYQQRERKMRDVATAFLLDLSASTDEWVLKTPSRLKESGEFTPRPPLSNLFARDPSSDSERFAQPEGSKRVIDIERETLVIMSEALESLGDEYAIYGFSGYGRDNVEFFPIKEFSEPYSEQVRCRIGAFEPRKSTRMGPAIRHTIEKLAATDCRLKALILLSDGYPQDFDYGPDRSTRDYGLHDTMVALREARKKNVHTFCVTVDQAGNDYLREMCGGDNYLVVERPDALPRILPRVYRGLTV